MTSLVGRNFVVLVAVVLSFWTLGKASAQNPPKPGFQSGAKPFTPNPFSNSVAAESDDEEDDEEDFNPPARPASPTGGGIPQGSSLPAGSSISAGGQSKSDGPDPVRTAGGIDVGGSGSGVISRNKVDAIRIDSESGEGSKETVTDFNFPDADIMDIAKTLGKLTGKNFILEKDVKGKITVITNGPIKVADAWRAFLTALDINNLALIPSGNFIRIARARDAREKQLKIYSGEQSPDSDALITKVFQLKYINAEEVARAFHQFIPPAARIFPYEQTNTIIVTDTGSNIAKLTKILDLLDVEGYDAGIEVVPVKFASAGELSKLIDSLLPGTSVAGGAGSPGAPPRFGGGGGRFNSRRTKEGGVINTIISDERTNSLIVHANAKGADQVRELVAKLDQKIPSPTGGGKVHVRYLQFADAEQIATTINNLLQGAGSRSASAGMPGAAGGTGTNPVAATLFEGSIRVSPDKATNSLVVTASPADFVTVERVINRLDIPRDEVYVEVVIMEIGISKTFDFSANLISPTSKIGYTTASAGTISSFLQNGGLTAGLSGLALGFSALGTGTVTINNTSYTVGNLMALVQLLQTNANANVLATPQILAIDNEEAEFTNTEKIPVDGGTTMAANGLAQSQVTPLPLTLSIKIKPQINKISNFVKLAVEAKSGDVSSRQVPSSLQGRSVATIDRSAKTTVIVADSDTAVLGGLIRDKVDDQETKVPILGDIPILGWLFKSRTTQMQKTNMLIFLTPHIVRKYEKVRALLDKKLKERDDWIETNAGGKDPMRGKRDNMIRELPDLKELLNQKVQTSVNLDEDQPAVLAPPSDNGTQAPPTSQTSPQTTPQATPVDQGVPAAPPPAPEAALPPPPAGELPPPAPPTAPPGGSQ